MFKEMLHNDMFSGERKKRLKSMRYYIKVHKTAKHTYVISRVGMDSFTNIRREHVILLNTYFFIYKQTYLYYIHVYILKARGLVQI